MRTLRAVLRAALVIAAAVAPVPGEQREVTSLAGPFNPAPPVVAATAMPQGGATVVATDRPAPFLDDGPGARLEVVRLSAAGAVSSVTTATGEVDTIGPDPGNPECVVLVTADSTDLVLRANHQDLGRGSEPALAYDAPASACCSPMSTGIPAAPRTRAS